MEQAPEILTVTAADAMEVLKANPLAMEQLKAIIYARLLAERDEELAALKAEMDVIDITSATGDAD